MKDEDSPSVELASKKDVVLERSLEQVLESEQMVLEQVLGAGLSDQA